MKRISKRDQQPALLSDLKRIAPLVAVSADREVDEFFTWDGDGPDPKRRGYQPCNVTVRVRIITQGELFEGTNHLGGSYYRAGEAMGDVHGYLPQMVDEAVADLVKSHHMDNNSLMQLNAVHQHLEAHMRSEWEAQQAAK